MRKLLSTTALMALSFSGTAFAETAIVEARSTAEANQIMLAHLIETTQMTSYLTEPEEQVSKEDPQTRQTIWDRMATLDLEQDALRQTTVSNTDYMYQPGLIETPNNAERIEVYETNATAPVDENGIDTMVQLLEISDLDEQLDGSKSYTVFAPTNAAFKDIDSEQMSRFKGGFDANKLEALLSAHIVEGEVMAGDVSAETTEIEAQSGERLAVRRDAIGQVRVDNAFVLTSDATASNGVIHVIDGVIS